jgi:DNA-binding transcriptional regulator GbsR (MarR family)
MELNQKTREFIEKMGLLFEHAGSTRTHGRMMGLMLVSDKPLSLDEMADQLRVSKASLSTNARLAVQIGMAQRVSLPGDRKDYYEMSPGSFERMVADRVRAIDAFVRLADEGLFAVAPENTGARHRLQKMKDFYLFFLGELQSSLERWHEHENDGARR